MSRPPAIRMVVGSTPPGAAAFWAVAGTWPKATSPAPPLGTDPRAPTAGCRAWLERWEVDADRRGTGPGAHTRVRAAALGRRGRRRRDLRHGLIRRGRRGGRTTDRAPFIRQRRGAPCARQDGARDGQEEPKCADGGRQRLQRAAGEDTAQSLAPRGAGRGLGREAEVTRAARHGQVGAQAGRQRQEIGVQRVAVGAGGQALGHGGLLGGVSSSSAAARAISSGSWAAWSAEGRPPWIIGHAHQTSSITEQFQPDPPDDSRRASRPRWMRDLTVPSETPVIWAISG